MDEDQVYDFCLDWQMNQMSKKILCKRFVKYGWNFGKFKEFTETKFWFVNSMYALLFAYDFAQ